MALTPNRLMEIAPGSKLQEEEAVPQLTIDTSDEEVIGDGELNPASTAYSDYIMISATNPDHMDLNHAPCCTGKQTKGSKPEEIIDPEVLLHNLAVFTIQTEEAPFDFDFEEMPIDEMFDGGMLAGEMLDDDGATGHQMVAGAENIPEHMSESLESETVSPGSHTIAGSEQQDEGLQLPQFWKDRIQDEAHKVGVKVAENMKTVILQWAADAAQELALSVIADAEEAANRPSPQQRTTASYGDNASASNTQNPTDILISFLKQKEKMVTEAIRSHINKNIHELFNAALPGNSVPLPAGAPTPVAADAAIPMSTAQQAPQNLIDIDYFPPLNFYEFLLFPDLPPDGPPNAFMARVPTPDFTVIGKDLKEEDILPAPDKISSQVCREIAKVPSKGRHGQSHPVRYMHDQGLNTKKLARSLILCYLFLLAMPEEVPINIFFQTKPVSESTGTANTGDRQIMRTLTETAFANRYWVLDFTSSYCCECVDEIMQERKRAFLKRWIVKIKSNLAAVNHCPACRCEHSHTDCDHSSEFYQWLHSIGNTVGRLQYIKLTSSACSSVNSESLASAINILKRHAHNLLGAQVNLDIPGNPKLQIIDKTQIGKLIHCFTELEKLLPADARLQILGLEFHPRLSRRWGAARRPWWVGTGGKDHLLLHKKSLEPPLPPLLR